MAIVTVEIEIQGSAKDIITNKHEELVEDKISIDNAYLNTDDRDDDFFLFKLIGVRDGKE